MRVAVGFSRTNFLPSKAIRYFTNSPVSHVYIRYWDPLLKCCKVLHSDFGGVQFSLADRFDAENISVVEYLIDDPRLNKAIADNLWHLHKGYHYKRIWSWMWLIILKRWFVRKLKDPTVNPKSLICVDFVLYILISAGLVNLQIGQFTPKDLLEWFQKNHQDRGWLEVISEDSKYLVQMVREFLQGDPLNATSCYS